MPESELRLGKAHSKNAIDRINGDRYVLTGETIPINIFKQKDSVTKDSVNEKDAL